MSPLVCPPVRREHKGVSLFSRFMPALHNLQRLTAQRNGIAPFRCLRLMANEGGFFLQVNILPLDALRLIRPQSLVECKKESVPVNWGELQKTVIEDFKLSRFKAIFPR